MGCKVNNAEVVEMNDDRFNRNIMGCKDHK